MKKICVKLYGGRSLVGGKEQPLVAYEIFCDKANNCTLYMQGKCLNCRSELRFKCPNGNVVVTKGYTSRARKYIDFEHKYTSDEVYNKLTYPESDCFAVVGDMYWFKLDYIMIRKANARDACENVNAWGYVITDSRFSEGLSYISIIDMSVDFLYQIFTYGPSTYFNRSEVEEYKQKIIPKILYSMKRYAPQLYLQFVMKYPEYKNDTYTPNYVGKEAYTKTLRNGAILYDYYGNEGILKDGKIYCNNYMYGAIPFNGKRASVIVDVSETDTYKINNNAQVDKNTKFI